MYLLLNLLPFASVYELPLCHSQCLQLASPPDVQNQLWPVGSVRFSGLLTT